METLTANKSFAPLFKAYVRPLGLFALGVVIYVFFYALSEGMMMAFAGVLALYLTPAAVSWVKTLRSAFTLEAVRVCVWSGKKVIYRVELAQVDWIDLEMPIMGTMVDFGDIVFHLHTGQRAVLKSVKRPHRFAEEASERLRIVKRKSL